MAEFTSELIVKTATEKVGDITIKYSLNCSASDNSVKGLSAELNEGNRRIGYVSYSTGSTLNINFNSLPSTSQRDSVINAVLSTIDSL